MAAVRTVRVVRDGEPVVVNHFDVLETDEVVDGGESSGDGQDTASKPKRGRRRKAVVNDDLEGEGVSS